MTKNIFNWIVGGAILAGSISPNIAQAEEETTNKAENNIQKGMELYQATKKGWGWFVPTAFEQEKLKKAHRLFKQAKTLQPENLDALYGIMLTTYNSTSIGNNAITLINNNYFDEEELRQVYFRIEKEDVFKTLNKNEKLQVLTYISDFYAKQGNKVQAKKRLEKMHRIDPKNQETNYKLASITKGSERAHYLVNILEAEQTKPEYKDLAQNWFTKRSNVRYITAKQQQKFFDIPKK